MEIIEVGRRHEGEEFFFASSMYFFHRAESTPLDLVWDAFFKEGEEAVSFVLNENTTRSARFCGRPVNSSVQALRWYSCFMEIMKTVSVLVS
ncbi:glycosyltransferase BC10-like isoform X2 [Dioscorea cayenensis subsp. rotundata]|uniref:Glycosyltransferase BC10-like isoform X2 n=1 Tax=Dioscorea cayennensis subsp. rotundata TaxID=55577 RepID=A0AB40C4K7_DIOCR|nr:glycosyltransferase BC10-like isoform X2 [Dioscorea cayenensis subsp. rotundata]XP_039133499.1 glycosyltransferase BC10-like isoform X2 [Dioscorea cayenensis subsp. rotundata]